MGETGGELSTRDKLVRSAESNFLQQGYSATSVDEICRGAGATKGAFFHYFRSKKEIGLEALQVHAKKRFALMYTGAPEDLGPSQRLLAYVDHLSKLVVLGESPACLLASTTAELAEVDDDFKAGVRSLFGEWIAQVEELAKAAFTEAGQDTADAAMCAAQTVATFQGALMLRRATGSVEQSQGMLQAYKAQLATRLQA